MTRSYNCLLCSQPIDRTNGGIVHLGFAVCERCLIAQHKLAEEDLASMKGMKP